MFWTNDLFSPRLSLSNAKTLTATTKSSNILLGDWRLRASGVSESAIENPYKMFECYDNRLRWLLKYKPMSLEDFIQEIAKNLGVVQ